MKTEYEIAEELVKEFQVGKGVDGKLFWKTNCKTHLSTLRRWLDFLCCLYAETDNKFIIEGKIKDIKQAIKIYEDGLGGKDE